MPVLHCVGWFDNLADEIADEIASAIEARVGFYAAHSVVPADDLRRSVRGNLEYVLRVLARRPVRRRRGSADRCPASRARGAAWRDNGGSASGAAGVLFCHPNTVCHRLRRIESATGRSLGDPKATAEILIALEAALLGIAQ